MMPAQPTPATAWRQRHGIAQPTPVAADFTAWCKANGVQVVSILSHQGPRS